MLEESKNYCVFKLFGTTCDELENAVVALQTKGIVISASQECLDGRIVVENVSAQESEFVKILQDINDKFVGKIYSDSDVSLAQCVVDSALEKGVRISLAESITGGMICSSLVDVPGSSSVLVEGLVAYMEQSKVRRLHVKLKTLEKYGIVSAPVAKEMVQGLLENSNVTLSLSTTGCAGPSSDKYDTPVGLAFIAIGNKDGITAQEVMFEGSRNYIRNCVKETALYMLLKNINNKR